MTAVIETGIPVPPVKRYTAVRPLSNEAAEILEALRSSDLNDSFLVDGQYKRVALIAGRMAAKLRFGVRAATDTVDSTKTRVWRVEPKVKGPKKPRKAKADAVAATV